MDEKQKNSSLKRYNIINNNIDEENHRISISHKRRRCSITNEQTQLSSNNQDFIYERNLTMTNTIGSRKRSAQDDLITYTTHHFLRENESNKRARYEQSNSIELENQPPNRSLIFHPQQEQDLLSSTWNNLRSSNDLPLFFNEIIPSLTSYHEHNLSEHYSPLLTEHHHSSIFHENLLITSDEKSI